MPNFVHLNLHSEFSLSDGLSKIKPLLAHAKAEGIGALALTDHMNVFAAVKFYKAALTNGIKPILGAELIITNDTDAFPSYRLIALCQDITGYRNLTCLLSRAYAEGQQTGFPRIDPNWLPTYQAGLIVLSGGMQGDIGQYLLQDNEEAAVFCLNKWLNWFPGRFYLEIQRLGFSNENHYLKKVLSLAERFKVPVVATNAVRFLHAEDFEAHEARVSINQGMLLADPKRPRDYSPNQYLRPETEMQALFSDLPVALSNTVAIAKRCNVELNLGTYYLPDFPVPTNQTINDYFAMLAEEGLAKRLVGSVDIKKKSVYQMRLQEEIRVINDMGFAGYFLIVADFIQWAKNQNIPVGPGRGSGAGSLVAYALQITDIDPLPYDLLFERFLNPERVSMPDFDIDFCMEGRDLVIDYVAEKYGRDCVSQIITYGTMAAKAVVRDVGRVLGYPYGFVDKIAKLIPFELGMTLKKALLQEELLKIRYEQEDNVKELLDLAQKLEGVTRNAGKHAGGVVIAPTQLTDFCALYCEPDVKQMVTQFDKDDVESIGLVKFDFLGLRTLTIIHRTLERIRQRSIAIDISQIPLDDMKTFALLQECQTTAVFQLESRGMKDLIKRLQPDCFEDIIALVALFRPGPLQSGMVDDFIDRKHGRAGVEYPHPDLAPILSPTYGVILYQEQVMQIAQVLAGYTLGSADLLRRAISKKKTEEMLKLGKTFVEGAIKRGVDEKTAIYIFELMNKFADYGFNKSHSAAYALLAYQTAWLKAHYPGEFMAAVLSADMDNTDKVVVFIDECRQLSLRVCPPNINESYYQFTVNEQNELVYGLGAIKGAGEGAIAAIIDARQEKPFKDVFDLCLRVGIKKLNRRILEALVKSGALDSFQQERASLFATLEKAIKLAEQANRDQTSQQGDLLAGLANFITQTETYIDAQPWPALLRLEYEKETLGLYLTGHPLDHYSTELLQLAPCRVNTLADRVSQQVTLAGRITNLRFLQTKRGDRMAFVSLEDQTGRLELAVFSNVIQLCRDSLVKDAIVLVTGEVSFDDYNGTLRLSCHQLQSLERARQQLARYCLVRLPPASRMNQWKQLAEIIKSYQPGICPLRLQYQNHLYAVSLKCGDEWRFTPSDACLAMLRSAFGDDSVVVYYT